MAGTPRYIPRFSAITEILVLKLLIQILHFPLMIDDEIIGVIASLTASLNMDFHAHNQQWLD